MEATLLRRRHARARRSGGQYRELLKKGEMKPSMSRTGNLYDNAATECFNATYKRAGVGLAEEPAATLRGPQRRVTSSTTLKNTPTGSAATARSATSHLWTSRTNSTPPCVRLSNVSIKPGEARSLLRAVEGQAAGLAGSERTCFVPQATDDSTGSGAYGRRNPL